MSAEEADNRRYVWGSQNFHNLNKNRTQFSCIITMSLLKSDNNFFIISPEDPLRSRQRVFKFHRVGACGTCIKI